MIVTTGSHLNSHQARGLIPARKVIVVMVIVVMVKQMHITKSTLSKSMQPSIPPIGRRWTFSTSQVYIA